MLLQPEPGTDRPIDDFGRLLRYVMRADGVNVNLRLVVVGAAAPYFFEGRRGQYANRLETLAEAGSSEEARPVEGVSADGV